MRNGGRQKGTPNKTTAETKEMLQQVISNELNNIDDLLDKLEPNERINAVIKLLPYIVPKQVEIHQEDKPTQLVIISDYPEDLNKLLDN